MRNHEVNIDKFKFEGTKLKYIYIYIKSATCLVEIIK
jgi:hypothetical protein